MKKQLKVFLVFLCALILGATLVSCGGTTDDPEIDYDHTIIFYHTMGQNLQTKLEIAKEAFAKKYPGWKVESTQVGGYDQVREKIVADYPANLQPDLAYCYADHVALYMQGRGKVVDLSKYIDSDEEVYDETSGKTFRVGFTAEELADFVSGFYQEGLATNYADYEKYGFTSTSLLTLPYSKSTELMYYNKTALDELGLTPATTWAELWRQAEIIAAKWPTVTPVGYDSEANWFITMCEQNGWGYTTAAGAADEHYLFNNANVKAWLEEIAGYYAKGWVTTKELYGGQYTSDLFKKGTDGGAIYCIGSSGGASNQNPGDKFQYGIAPIPGSSDTAEGHKVISQGPSLVMFYCDQLKETTKDAKAKMTLQFVKELMDPVYQAEFSMTSGYMPVRMATYEIEAFQAHLNDTSNITAVAAKVASTLTDRYFTSPAFVGSSTARDQVGAVVQQVLPGVKTAQKALDDALDNCGGRK